MNALRIICLPILAVATTTGEPETRFLVPDKQVFETNFEEGDPAPAKPNWFLRKSEWVSKEGMLRGINAGGNGPFIRLHPKAKGGVLPDDYILKFSFRIEENKEVKRPNGFHEKFSRGHRFSFGHYAAGFGWDPTKGSKVSIGHGRIFEQPEFKIEKNRWYHVTAEIRGDEILVWYQDGPAWYLQHEHIRTRPQGWEFFTHASEVGILDKIQVWSLAAGEQKGWPTQKDKLSKAKRAFLSSENPDFSISKPKKQSQ